MLTAPHRARRHPTPPQNSGFRSITFAQTKPLAFPPQTTSDRQIQKTKTAKPFNPPLPHLPTNASPPAPRPPPPVASRPSPNGSARTANDQFDRDASAGADVCWSGEAAQAACAAAGGDDGALLERARGAAGQCPGGVSARWPACVGGADECGFGWVAEELFRS